MIFVGSLVLLIKDGSYLTPISSLPRFAATPRNCGFTEGSPSRIWYKLQRGSPDISPRPRCTGPTRTASLCYVMAQCISLLTRSTPVGWPHSFQKLLIMSRRRLQSKKPWRVWVSRRDFPDKSVLSMTLTRPYSKNHFLPGMEVQLLPHQVIGVSWMVRQERESGLKGGILADEMGL